MSELVDRRKLRESFERQRAGLLRLAGDKPSMTKVVTNFFDGLFMTLNAVPFEEPPDVEAMKCPLNHVNCGDVDLAPEPGHIWLDRNFCFFCGRPLINAPMKAYVDG